MRRLVLLAIRLYQRFLSPHKGFCCAYGAYTGHASCSALGYRAISRFGVLQGMQLLDRRLEKCGVAYRRYRSAALDRQAGFCDLPCDAPGDCDLPCDCADLFGSGSGSKKKNRRNSRADRDVHVPPRRRSQAPT